MNLHIRTPIHYIHNHTPFAPYKCSIISLSAIFPLITEEKNTRQIFETFVADYVKTDFLLKGLYKNTLNAIEQRQMKEI